MDMFEVYRPIAKALSALLSPHAEIVLHNLKRGKIEEIYNNLSKRSIGEDSLIDPIDSSFEEKGIIGPYFKENWNGKAMKSISILLRNPKGKAFGMMCINLDISKWEEMQHFIDAFLHVEEKKPKVLFGNDWKDKVNHFVSTYLKEHSLYLDSLTRLEKKSLLKALQKEGAFEEKNAASYIADVLKISRATVYNYLKEML